MLRVALDAGRQLQHPPVTGAGGRVAVGETSGAPPPASTTNRGRSTAGAETRVPHAIHRCTPMPPHARAAIAAWRLIAARANGVLA
jgi:hypothetical protein